MQEQQTSVPATSNLVKRNFIIGFLGLIGFALVVSLGVGIYRVYAKAATDPFTVGVATALRLPVIKVDGKTALYAEYVDDLRAITTMRDYDKANNGPAAALNEEDLSNQVLYRQVNNILISNLAKEYNLKVEDADVSTVKSEILEKEFQSLENAEKAIKERYGWTMKDFEKKVIKPFVLQGKLTELVKNDEVAKETIRARAQSVLDQIKTGADFAELAAEYGEDATAERGGDLGWFGKGEMVPAFENAAFALKKGELAQNLVESQFGFHILKVDDKKTDKVKDDKGKLVNKELVKARHILFMLPTLENKLNDRIKSADIKVYPRMNNPFEDLNQAS